MALAELAKIYLAQVERQIVATEERIARQRVHLQRLTDNSLDTRQAERLLALFTESYRLLLTVQLHFLAELE